MKRVIFFNLTIIAIIFLSLEFFLRTFNIIELQGFDKDSIYKENEINYHKPNILMNAMGEKSRTDKNGFRIPLENYKYENNLQTILVLGDSVGFGVSVKEKNTFIGLLRKKINKNFFNASVAGHRMEDYSFLIKKYNNQFPFIKEVLIFICINDIVTSQGIVHKEKFKIKKNNGYDNIFYRIFKTEFFLKLNFYLREKSTVFNLLKSIGTQNVKRHYHYITPYYEDKIYLDRYEKNLKQVIEYSKKNDLNVKFFLMPYKHQIKKKCEPNVMKPQTEINNMFQRLNFKLFDFSKDFCNKKDNRKLFLRFDPMHLSSYGHQFVLNLLIKNNIVN